MSLISAVLAEGTPAGLHKVLAKGVTSELLRSNDGALAQFEFIVQYCTQYNELPTIAIVEARTGIAVAPLSVGGSAEFWADELKKKALTSLLRKWSDQVRTDISNMEPQVGYEHWLECVREVQSHQVAAPCKTLAYADLGDLTKDPPPISWFMVDTRDDKHCWVQGKISTLIANGGAGKGYAALQLAVATVSDRLWLDTFAVRRKGHVVLMAAEDDKLELQWRLRRIGNALGLTDAERSKLKEYLHVLPLAGLNATFLEQDLRTHEVACTEFAKELGEFLIDAPWGDYALVIIDPLARIAGECETSNSLATELVSMIERLVLSLPGEPATLLCHHASMSSVRSGKPEARGVTGLRNGWRSEFTLTPVLTEDGEEGLLLSTPDPTTRRGSTRFGWFGILIQTAQEQVL